MNLTKSAAIAATISLATMGVAQAGTLEDVKAKGSVVCGVSQGLPGFSNPDSTGNWSGLDVDTCGSLSLLCYAAACQSHLM